MSDADLVIRGRKVVLPKRPNGGPAGIGPASIHIKRGVIAGIAGYDDVPSGSVIESADEGSIVMPGLVDTHVHVNEPGRTEWEGFASAARAAAAGGVTTLIDMPLNSIPPTTTSSAPATTGAVAATQIHLDVGFGG